MSAGNLLCTLSPHGNQPPASGYATFDTRNSHLVLEFDDASTESAYWQCLMPRHYAGGGVTATIVWMGATATSGNVVWGVAFERHDDEVTDLDADSFATAGTATAATAATSGAVQYTAIAFTNGAAMDSIAAGEAFRIRVQRVGGDAADTMAGDAQLLCVEVRETP